LVAEWQMPDVLLMRPWRHLATRRFQKPNGTRARLSGGAGSRGSPEVKAHKANNVAQTSAQLWEKRRKRKENQNEQ
jgi:hypothetical protein